MAKKEQRIGENNKVVTNCDQLLEPVANCDHLRPLKFRPTLPFAFTEQGAKVYFVQIPHKNHDRFLIIDDTVYQLGASVKDLGSGLCAVTKLMITPERVLCLLK